MNEQTQKQASQPMPEQITYANILFAGAWVGIALMVITYIIYISGLMEPHVPIPLIIENWGKGVGEYLHNTNSPTGWGWFTLLGKGDFLNFAGIALLALLTIFCYFFLIYGYNRRNDRIFFIISILEVIVLTVAASGILGTGGH
jgi:hypothetical protein